MEDKHPVFNRALRPLIEPKPPGTYEKPTKSQLRRGDKRRQIEIIEERRKLLEEFELSYEEMELLR